MPRHQLSNDQWECIRDLFPAPANTGRPPSDQRTVMNAILWILRTGSAWRDIPSEYGPWRTIYGLFNAWNSDGTLDSVLDRMRTAHFDGEQIDGELWCIDGTITRAHRCAAGGGKKTTRPNQLIMR